VRALTGWAAASAIGALSVAGLASGHTDATRGASRVAVPTAVPGRAVWVNTPRGFAHGRVGSSRVIFDTDPTACPGLIGAQKIAVCFARRSSVVPDSAEMSRVALSLGGPIEPNQCGPCGTLIQRVEPPVRPAAYLGQSRIGGYDVGIRMTSVVRVNGSHLTGGKTQAALPYPGGTQILVYVVGKSKR
jgi:hypothetical protein